VELEGVVADIHISYPYGMLEPLREQLDAGQAGLIVVAVSDMESRVREALKRADKLAEKELKVDQEALAKDAEEASSSS
ncbi:MAG TPA: hypothetical protein PL137_17890, partial [Nocardioides sp.]|nr:hypothetical protein [Nocardioides sp.]